MRGNLTVTQVEIHRSTLHILYFLIEVHLGEEMKIPVTSVVSFLMSPISFLCVSSVHLPLVCVVPTSAELLQQQLTQTNPK